MVIVDDSKMSLRLESLIDTGDDAKVVLNLFVTLDALMLFNYDFVTGIQEVGLCVPI